MSTERARLTVKVLADNKGTRWIGYYGHKRRQAGEVFDLNEKEDFSKRWMEPIGWTPEGYVKVKNATAVTKAPLPPRTPIQKNPNMVPAPAGLGQGPAKPAAPPPPPPPPPPADEVTDPPIDGEGADPKKNDDAI